MPTLPKSVQATLKYVDKELVKTSGASPGALPGETVAEDFDIAKVRSALLDRITELRAAGDETEALEAERVLAAL
jgi:hypothetical protein